MGVASLVLGIIGLISAWFTGGIAGFICGLLGVIFGAIGRKKPEQAGLATGGMVCGIICLALSIVAYLVCASPACLAACS